MNLRGYQTTIVNTALRAAGIFAKFLLIVYISKILSLEALGVYNLFSVTVAWSVFFIGFEFYSHSMRLLVGANTRSKQHYIFNQSLFHAAGFILLIPGGFLLSHLKIIDISLIPFFVGIVIFDELSQELYRLFLSFEQSQFSNLLYFIKTGLWIYFLFPLIYLGITVDVYTILLVWLSGTIAAFSLGVWQLKRLRVLPLKNPVIDLGWIKKGILTSFPFLISTISYLTIDFSDRYLINTFLGTKNVGIYSFYFGIANVPITLITNVITAQYYPKVIRFYQAKPPEPGRHRHIRNYILQNLGIALATSLGSIVLIRPLIEFIGRPELYENVNLFYLMLVQAFIFSFQVVFQTILYAKYKDQSLLYTSIIGAILNIIMNIILLPRIGLVGAVYSTIASLLVMSALRGIILMRIKS